MYNIIYWHMGTVVGTSWNIFLYYINILIFISYYSSYIGRPEVPFNLYRNILQQYFTNCFVSVTKINLSFRVVFMIFALSNTTLLLLIIIQTTRPCTKWTKHRGELISVRETRGEKNSTWVRDSFAEPCKTRVWRNNFQTEATHTMSIASLCYSCNMFTHYYFNMIERE